MWLQCGDCDALGPVPERLISANPGLKFCSVFVFCFPMCYLDEHFVFLLLYLREKAQQYFVSSSCMFLDKKTLLKGKLNPGLNLIIFRGTRPWALLSMSLETDHYLDWKEGLL